jgi:hypothetical protein
VALCVVHCTERREGQLVQHAWKLDVRISRRDAAKSVGCIPKAPSLLSRFPHRLHQRSLRMTALGGLTPYIVDPPVARVVRRRATHPAPHSPGTKP